MSAEWIKYCSSSGNRSNWKKTLFYMPCWKCSFCISTTAEEPKSLKCIWNKLEISFCSNKSGCKTQTFRDQEKYPQVNCARFSSLVWSCHVLSRHAKGINISTNAPFLVKISTEKRMIAPRIGIQIQYLTAMSVGAPRVGKDLCNDNKRGNNIPPPP